MDDRVYTAFLIGVGRNSATFATFTHFTRSGEDGTEWRIPSILPAEKLNEVFYEIDRAANTVGDWSDLYRWLGRDVGTWAAFTEESASRLVRHWFSDSVEFNCRFIQNGPAEFVDINSFEFSEKHLEKFHDLTGEIDSREGHVYTVQIRSNLVLTTLPIFVD
jgi:hypothetical protein